MGSETHLTKNQKMKASAGRFQTGKILALSIGHFIHDVYSSFLSPLLPLLIEKLSLTLTQAGFLSTIMQLPALLNPYIGVLADRISVRYFVILAPAITAVPMSLIGVAPSYGILLLLLFITGISASLFHVPAPVIVANLSAARTGRGMSFFMTGGELARTIGPLAAVAGVSLLGLEGFYPVMVFGLFSTIWLYLKLRDVPVNAVHTKRKLSAIQTWRKLRYILWPLTAILVSRGFMHASLTAFLPTYINQQTGNLWLAGMALTLFEVAGVAGVLTAGSMSDLIGRRKTLLVSLVGAPICLFVFSLTGGWIRITVLLVTGFTLLSTTPVMLALVQEQGRDAPAAANGLFMMISFIARSAVVVVVGYIADRIGLQATYLISAAMGLIGIPFIFKLPKK
jgi:FSR family fosmidomycin resistance protein-like MFS transporter